MNKNDISIISQIDIIDVSKIPPERLNSLAKTALDAMRTAYSDPEFVKGFERWKNQNGKGQNPENSSIRNREPRPRDA